MGDSAMGDSAKGDSAMGDISMEEIAMEDVAMEDIAMGDIAMEDIDLGDLPAENQEEQVVEQHEDNNGENQPPRLDFYKLIIDTDELLTAFASGLSINDLKNFRLISHTFYRTSLEPWRKKTVLRLNFDDPDVSRPGDLRAAADAGMLKLKDAVKIPIDDVYLLKLEKYPYSQIRIFNWNYILNTGVAQINLIKTFFMKWSSILCKIDIRQGNAVGEPRMIQALKYANKLTHLTLNGCPMPDFTPQNDEFVETDETIRNVRGLTVTHLTIDAIDYQDAIEPRSKCFTFLTYLPLLRELTLYLRCPTMSRFYQPEIELMSCLRQFRDKHGNGQLTVKILETSQEDFNGTINELLGKRFPIEGCDTIIQPPRFQECLRLRALNLVALKIDHSIENADINVYRPEFPFGIELPVLSQLGLQGKVTNSYNFLNFMPNLVTVIMRLESTTNNDAGNEDFMDNTLEAYKTGVTMQHLTNLDLDVYFKVESLPVLKRMIPNLTTLNMVVQSNAMFRFICANWLGLKKFCVLAESRVDDRGITGLDGDGDSVRHPNLTNLNALERFEISSKLRLTNQSVNLCFINIASLEDLVVRTRVKFSEECRDLLIEKFGAEHVVIPPSNSSCCCFA